MTKKIEIANPNAQSKTGDEWVNSRDGKKRFTMDMPIELHTRLKIFTAKQGETMADFACKVLDEYLSSRTSDIV